MTQIMDSPPKRTAHAKTDFIKLISFQFHLSTDNSIIKIYMEKLELINVFV